MKELIGGIFVLTVGLIFLWVAIFKFDEFYVHYKEFNENKIEVFKFLNDYWFTRILFISLGALLIFLILYSLVFNHFR